MWWWWLWEGSVFGEFQPKSVFFRKLTDWLILFILILTTFQTIKVESMCLHVSENFSLYTKIILFFYCVTKKCWIAQKFPDSNAILLPGFFSLYGCHISFVKCNLICLKSLVSTNLREILNTKKSCRLFFFQLYKSGLSKMEFRTISMYFCHTGLVKHWKSTADPAPPSTLWPLIPSNPYLIYVALTTLKIICDLRVFFCQIYTTKLLEFNKKIF